MELEADDYMFSLGILAREQHRIKEQNNSKVPVGVCVSTNDRDGVLSLNCEFQKNPDSEVHVLKETEAANAEDTKAVKHTIVGSGIQKDNKTFEITRNAKSEKILLVNLNTLKCDITDKTVKEYKEGEIKLKHRLTDSDDYNISFFPLAIDDYFMAVAIISGRLDTKLAAENSVGACVASNESSHVVGAGSNGAEGRCAAMQAIHNAMQSRVDLTKCSLYVTEVPCPNCIEAILRAGIRVVVHRDSLKPEDKERIYEAKACFQEYRCYIPIDENAARDDLSFLIDLSKDEYKVHAKSLVQLSKEEDDARKKEKVKNKEQKEQNEKETSDRFKASRAPKPSHRDFFMAIAFLAGSRTKDNKFQVGSCLVTDRPHRLVAMGYNGMPDGRGFKDEHMPWGTKNYSCHSETNAIISGFRREADLSGCTLYVTYSPCAGCCKVIAQAGIKRVEFAKYHRDATAGYEVLQRLPGMNITKYMYNPESESKNRAKITLNLVTLCATLTESKAEFPQEDPDPAKGKGRNVDLDFPLDDFFMSLALLATTRSRIKEQDRVGACLVNHEPRRAISVGYNGYPDDLDDVNKDDYVCCAELNAIVSAFRYHADLTNSTLYTTGVPCPKCAQMIVQSGIKTVVYFAGGMKVKVSKEMEKCVEEMKNDAQIMRNDAAEMRKDLKRGKTATKNAKIITKNVERVPKQMEGFIEVMEEVRRKAEETDREGGEMKKEAEEMRSKADEMKKEAEEMRSKANKMDGEGDEMKEEAEEMRSKADEMKKEADKMEKEADEMNRKGDEMKRKARDMKGNADYIIEGKETAIKKKVEENEKIFTKGVMAEIDSIMQFITERGKMEREAKEIFYWAKVATLEYKCHTKDPTIEIDLHEKTTRQMDTLTYYSTLKDEPKVLL